MVEGRNILLALFATSALVSPSVLVAQTATTLPRFQTVDENGVDLVTGNYVAPFVEGAIGSGKGAVSIIRNSGGPDQWSGLLYQTTIGGVTTIVAQFGPISDTFTLSGSTWVPTKGNGARLAQTGEIGEWLYTASDGSAVMYESVFDSQFKVVGPACTNAGADLDTCAIPVSLSRPDGLLFALNWNVVEVCGGNTFPCPNPQAFVRFLGVTNSANYQFTRTYKTDDPGQFGAPVSDWYVRTGANFFSGGVKQFGVTYAFPSSGVEQVTDGAGRVWTFTNAADGSFHFRRPGSASDNIIVTYNPTNGTVTSVAKDGVTTSYSRAVNGSTGTITTTDPLGHHKTIVADLNLGRVKSITDELGHQIAYAYDTNARLTRVTQPEGNYTQYAYDARGNVTTTAQVAKPGSTLANVVTSASFDSTCSNVVTCNQPNSTTDAKGNVTNYTYDPTHGGVLTVTQPAPAAGGVRPQTRFAYTQITGAGGAHVYMLTSAKACPSGSTCTTADEVSASATYNPNLLPATITRGNSSGTLAATDTFTYDAVGNLLTDDGPLPGTGDTTSYQYDAARQLTRVTLPDPDGAGAMLPRAIRLTYRGDGQISKEELGTVSGATFSPLETVDISFDTNSRPVQRKLSGGAAAFALTQTDYDSVGRVNCTAVRMNAAVYGSLPASACTLSTQGSFGPDRISKNIYDNASELTQVQEGVGTADAANERTLTYSNNGLMTSLTDGENNKTTYVYDGFDRLSQTQYPSPTKGSGTSNAADFEQLTYDANGNVTARQIRNGLSILFTYDNLDRVTFKDVPNTLVDMTYTYDNLGRLTSAAQPQKSVSFTYDALSRKLTEVVPQGTVASAYDLAGRRTQLTYPGTGLFVNTDYLVTGEVQKIRENGAVSGIGVLATYAYDNLGNRTSVTYGNGTSTSYSYDPVSRLTILTNDLAGTTNDLTIGAIGYNPASQITSQTRSNDAYAWTGHGNGSTATVTNGLNELVSVGGAAAAYSSKGVLTTEPTTGTAYGYSNENQLISAPGTTISYDAMMRLYQVTGATSTQFAYDGSDLIAEYQGSAVQKRYVFGPGTNEPIVQYDAAGNRSWMTADERGSIVAFANDSGTATAIDTYDEYGKPGATNSGRFQYTGQMWLPEAALYHYKARDYLPQLGVFAEPDPIGQDGGPNLYAYVGGDPVNQADPTGLCTPYVTSIGASPVISGCRLEDAPRFSSGGPLISPGERNGGCVGDCRPIVVNAPRKPPSRQCSSHPILNALGIINALPASAITATIGVLGSAAGTFAGTHPYARFGNNALQFRNIPFVSRAFTFGNVTIYGIQNPGNTTLYDSYTGRVSLALHEEAHTKQSEILGPGAYFVSHLMLGIGSGSNPLEQRADAYARGQSCTGF